MRMIKLALLATAASAVMVSTAQADEIAELRGRIDELALKLQSIEAAPKAASNKAQLELSSAPAIEVPSLEGDDNYAKMATTVTVTPAADVVEVEEQVVMPSGTRVQWTGYARAALAHENLEWNETVSDAAGAVIAFRETIGDDTHIYARGQVKVVGTTDTALGEVGAKVEFRANFEGHNMTENVINEAWGWWKMTPELTLGGGYTGSLANIAHGYDGACDCFYTNNAPMGFGFGNLTQMRLSYDSGPVGFAIAVEDRDDVYSNIDATWTGGSTLGVSGQVSFSGDTFSAELSGGYWGAGRNSQVDHYAHNFNPDPDGDGDYDPPALFIDALGPHATASYQVGAGATAKMDAVKLSVAAGMGQSSMGYDYWKASALGSVSMSDSMHVELAYGYADIEGYHARGTEFDWYTGDVESRTHAVLGGVYYDPSSAVTIGLEGEWQQSDVSGTADTGALDGTATESYTGDYTRWSADLVTVFRF